MDEAVGRAVEILKRKGMYDRTALMFSSGFGRSDAGHGFDLNSFIGERYQLFTHPGRPREWLEAEAITAPSGTSMAHLYLRKDDSWSERSFFEDGERRGLVGALLEREGVDCIAGRSVEGGVVVTSQRGRAHVVEDHDGRITYITKGGDPFGYTDMPQVMQQREVLIKTIDTDYPDGITQLMQVFRSSRAGDLVVSAKVDCDLSISGLASTHGSLSRAHLDVPFVSSVPFAPAPMRTADVFCFIMNLLGIDAEHGVDGSEIVVEKTTKKIAAKSL
jgi:hypothetical protein